MAATASPTTAGAPGSNSGPLPRTPGRTAALVFGVPVALALILGTGFSLLANFAEGRYNVSYTAPAGTRSLTMSSQGGALAIQPTAGSRLTLTGTARYSFVRSTLTEQTVGGGTTVRYRCPIPAGDCELDATVGVPAKLPVNVSTAGGDATVTGISAPVTLSSGGGNLTINQAAGPLTLNTGGGDIQATRVMSQTVSASSGGGNIEITFTKVPQHVTVHTGGGDVTLVLPAGPTQYKVSASSGGGNVSDTLPQDSTAANTITATSGGGNVTLSQQ